MTWEEFHSDEMKNTKILLLRKKCNGENKCKNRIGQKPATTRKEILQEMELISYYSEDFFFPQTFFGKEKKRNCKLIYKLSFDKATYVVLKYTEFHMDVF